MARVEPHEGGRATVAPTAELLRALVESACKFAKVSDANNLRKFAAVIAVRDTDSFDAFVSRATKALASRPIPPLPATFTDADLGACVKRLEEALGDELRFESVYQQISKDERLKAADAKKLAKAFSGKSGKTKADALGLIYGRHKNMMSAEPKADATGRRLAG
jgi:hypothetical protein